MKKNSLKRKRFESQSSQQKNKKELNAAKKRLHRLMGLDPDKEYDMLELLGQDLGEYKPFKLPSFITREMKKKEMEMDDNGLDIIGLPKTDGGKSFLFLIARLTEDEAREQITGSFLNFLEKKLFQKFNPTNLDEFFREFNHITNDRSTRQFFGFFEDRVFNQMVDQLRKYLSIDLNLETDFNLQPLKEGLRKFIIQKYQEDIIGLKNYFQK